MMYMYAQDYRKMEKKKEIEKEKKSKDQLHLPIRSSRSLSNLIHR